MPTPEEIWNKLAKEFDFPAIVEVTRYMKVVKEIGAWALTTEHVEAANEVKAVLFQHFPEILGD